MRITRPPAWRIALSLLLGSSIAPATEAAADMARGVPPRQLNAPYVRTVPLRTNDGDTVIVTPAHSTEVIVNPGKGWVLYGGVESQSPETLAVSSLGYTRYAWGEIEPEEGVFRWDIIDKQINGWAVTGRQFAFGVRCASSGAKDFWVSPKWVFDAGARYDTFELKDSNRVAKEAGGTKLVPIFDDPIFMKKLEHFINALAARYDGDPRVAYIDIRSYGNYGEGHMSPFNMHEISGEKYKEHIQLHRTAFKKTLLMLPVGNKKRPDFLPVFDWAGSVGIALRRDGICGNSNGEEVIRCAGKLPAVFELYDRYPTLVRLGWWDGKKDASGRGFRLADCVEIGMPTYCDLSRGGNFGIEFLAKEPVLVKELANRLGYHLVLTQAKYPRVILPSGEIEIAHSWENRGVAHMFVPATVAFALISADGKVAHVCDANASFPGTWKPDVPITVVDRISFRDAPPGPYTLAVGVRRHGDGLTPSIKLGVELRAVNGWYELGPISLR
jgi:hypothetical protein